MVTAPRVALVLGAGGITGGSFHAGTLAALADAGWDARTAELIIGTSAGSVVGGLLRGGLPPIDLVHRVTGSPLTDEGHRIAGTLGPSPNPPQLQGFRLPRVNPLSVAAAAVRKGSVNPFAIAAASMPEGTARNDYMIELLGTVIGHDWPQQALWIVAVRQRDGQRVVFGQGSGPHPTVGHAAAASAAVPGLFTPITIDGESHIDGGVWSVHNLDLVAESPRRFDLVIVSAPMARAERRPSIRADLATAAAVSVQLDQEVARMRRDGARVVVVAPTDQDRDVMGPAPMDPSRRAPVAEHIHASLARRLTDGELGAALSPLLNRS